ncbi:MAG: chromosome condensation regulator RCC1, partial [Sandaracinus sp.]|nr:chromosome condensation regulator RCC1 [Sandaracinus sp.]
SAGQGHTLAVTVQGLMVGFGRNSDSELGLGPSAPIQRRTPTQVGDGTWRDVAAGQSHSCALSSTNEVHCFGSNSSAQLGLADFADRDVPTPLGLPDTDVVATNTFHGCAIRLGELHCWGRNVEGQLGTGDVEDRPSPTRIGTDTDWTHVACGRFYTCARKRDGRVLCTGANESGQLGVGDFERRRVFTEIAFGAE